MNTFKKQTHVNNVMGLSGQEETKYVHSTEQSSKRNNHSYKISQSFKMTPCLLNLNHLLTNCSSRQNLKTTYMM
ncbi:hypothetical protein MUGA111182_06110 [Mucilaginibacter galii]